MAARVIAETGKERSSWNQGRCLVQSRMRPSEVDTNGRYAGRESALH